MRIALDYDGTYTTDPGLWGRFAIDALRSGHSLVIVSSRRCECTEEDRCEDHIELAEATGCRVVLTSGVAKRFHCESIGLKIDVWVDDLPESIGNGR